MANSEKVISGMLAYIIAGRQLRTTSVEAKCLLQYYCSNVNKDGTFFKSIFDTCYETGLSERFIHKTNAKWKAGGMLSWDQGGNFKHRANVYTINLDKLNKIVAQSIQNHDASRAKLRQQWAEASRKYRAQQD